MAKKTYISLTGIQYTFPVKVGDKTVFVSFKGSENTFETGDKMLQNVLEEHAKFKNEEIGLSYKEDTGETKGDSVVFGDIDTIEAAIALLNSEYKIPKTKLRTPQAVKEQAKMHNVLFPNLN